MIRPTWVYHFTRAINPKTGRPGTRYDLTGWEGPVPYAPLVHCLKRTGEPVLYLNRPRLAPGVAPDPRRPTLGLFAPGDSNVSGIFEPSPEHPGRGFGDVERKDALLTRRDEEAGSLTVFVFPGLGLQGLTLFMAWIDGGVSEDLLPGPPLLGEGPEGGCLDNNIYLDTDSVAGP
jgi:hypothetical protein